MGSRVEVRPDLCGRVPDAFEVWAALAGSPVARSRTTRTDRLEFAGLDLHLKRAYPPLRTALGAVFRNSFFGRSRAEREYRALAALPPGIAPIPVAFGERRCGGLLRESFLATLTVPGEPLSVHHLAVRGAADRLGRFLRRLRTAGLLHGSLFARNVLALPDGDFRVVDLDRARFSPGGLPWCAGLARDLARLDASLPGLPRATRLRVLRATGEDPPEGPGLHSRVAAVLGYRSAALRRLARRVPRDPAATRVF